MDSNLPSSSKLVLYDLAPAQNWDLSQSMNPAQSSEPDRAWYVAINGQKHGPMTSLASCAMMPAKQAPVDSLVWSAGMGQWEPAACFPDFAQAMGVPLRVITINAPPSSGHDVISTIIPVRNSAALIGYYMSVASLIPLVGLFLGPVAIVFGVKGLHAVKATPLVKGTVHAWVAIIMGSIVTLVNLAGIIAILLLSSQHLF